jgi:hypothetical protein
LNYLCASDFHLWLKILRIKHAPPLAEIFAASGSGICAEAEAAEKFRWLADSFVAFLAVAAMVSVMLMVELGLVWLMFREDQRPEVDSQQKLLFMAAAAASLFYGWIAARLWKRREIESAFPNTKSASDIHHINRDSKP